MQKKLLAVAMIGLVGFSCAVSAKLVFTPWTNVVDTLVTDGKTFGGCLAKLNIDIAKSAPSCLGGTASYVAFSCDGALQGADVGSRLFETAQMAQMLNKQMRVQVEDTKKQNGYCLVTRVDIR